MAAAFEILCDTSDRVDWLNERYQGLGASEIAIVLGEAPEAWGSPFSLYVEKTTGQNTRNLEDNEAVYWGNKLEAEILSAYSERTGRLTKRERFLLRSKAHPWALCTLDGRTWDPSNERKRWPLEVKNVSAFKAEEWVDGPPMHYYLQLQQQMLVCGDDKATIAALLGGQKMVWCDVPRDEMAIRRIVYNGERFWERVVKRDMPSPDGTEATRKALQMLYPDGKGVIELPATAAECADELERVKEELRRLEKRKDEIENTVRAALGDAEIGLLIDRRSFSWKVQKRRACTIPESTFRVLRLHQAK